MYFILCIDLPQEFTLQILQHLDVSGPQGHRSEPPPNDGESVKWHRQACQILKPSLTLEQKLRASKDPWQRRFKGRSANFCVLQDFKLQTRKHPLTNFTQCTSEDAPRSAAVKYSLKERTEDLPLGCDVRGISGFKFTV